MTSVKRRCGMGAVCAAVLGCAVVAPGADVVPVSAVYRGWDAVRLSNRYVSLQIVPILGGRVMEYALGNKNFLWVNPGLAGKAPPPGGVGPENAWLNYGGDKLWPAPQGWDHAEQWPGPPDAVLDGGPYQMELLPEEGAGAGVRLTSGEDRRSGIRFSRVIRLHEGSTQVSFEAVMKNIDTKPRRWGIWSHCQLDAAQPGGGHNAAMNAYCPINPQSRFTNGYAVIFGDEKNPSFQADAKRGLMRVQYHYKVGKIGLDSTLGWVATVDGSDGRVFVQRFTFEPGKEYPDGSSVEFWLNGTGSFRAWGKDNVMSDDPEKNPYVFESEVLSPFAKLQPGESYTWKYDWYAANIGAGKHEVTDCTDFGVTAEPLHAKTEGKTVRLTGRFGVFAPGRLALHFLDRLGQGLGRENLADPVSPLAPVILDRAAKLPDGTATIRLMVVDAAGKETGEIAKTDKIGK